MNYSAMSKEYNKVNAYSGATCANPYELIQLLMQGFLDRVASAKGAINTQDHKAKGVFISKAIGIINGLRGSLDMEKGGDLATNLDDLYEYMERQLMVANSENNMGKLDEVAHLMVEIKSGWDGIKQDVMGTQPTPPQGDAAGNPSVSVST